MDFDEFIVKMFLYGDIQKTRRQLEMKNETEVPDGGKDKTRNEDGMGIYFMHFFFIIAEIALIVTAFYLLFT